MSSIKIEKAPGKIGPMEIKKLMKNIERFQNINKKYLIQPISAPLTQGSSIINMINTDSIYGQLESDFSRY